MSGHEVPFWEKYLLTVNEAASYFHIGENRMRNIIDKDPAADYLISVGNRVMIKRKMFEEFVDISDAM